MYFISIISHIIYKVCTIFPSCYHIVHRVIFFVPCCFLSIPNFIYQSVSDVVPPLPTCVHFSTSAVAAGAAEAAAVGAAVLTTAAVVVVVVEAAVGVIPKLGMNSGTLGFRSGLIGAAVAVVAFWLAVLDLLEEEEEAAAAAARPLVNGADAVVVLLAPVVFRGIGCVGASASRGQNLSLIHI